MKIVDHSYYDKINSLICPYCHKFFTYPYVYSTIYKCNECHLTCCYNSKNNGLEWFDIALNFGCDFDFNSLAIGRSYFDIFLKEMDDWINLPFFNIFDYSISDLKNEIKQYLLFS